MKYFSLYELEEFKGPKGASIEHDTDFKPSSLIELLEKHIQERK